MMHNRSSISRDSEEATKLQTRRSAHSILRISDLAIPMLVKLFAAKMRGGGQSRRRTPVSEIAYGTDDVGYTATRALSVNG